MEQAVNNNDASVVDITDKVKEKILEEQKLIDKPIPIIEGFDSQSVLKALKANEVGDAWLLEALCEEKFSYDHSAGLWYRWNGNHWEEDGVDEIIKAVDLLVGEYGKEVQRQAQNRTTATKSSQADKAKQAEELERELLTRVKDLQCLHRRRNVLILARSGIDSLGISGNEWDSDPYLLGCANGIIDLRTGEYRKGAPQDYILKAAPTEWKGLHEPAPTWERFLLDVFDQDQNLAQFLQTLLGYAISGLSTEHIFPVLWGEGRNGKGTLLETINHVLGPIAGPIPSEMLLSKARPRSGAGPSSDIMALRGRRTAWGSETDEDRFLDTGKVKWLVGGDTLTGRPPYGKKQIEFTPTHTLFLLTNHKPHVSAEEYAMWKRIILVPFIMKFEDNPDPSNPKHRKRDPKMPEKLKEEASGILAWLVRGFLAWQEKGHLDPPPVVLEATKGYQTEEDVLGFFIVDYCRTGPDRTVRADDFYKGFKNWCQENGHKAMSNTKFGRRMSKRFHKDKDSSGRFYRGISVGPQYLSLETFSQDI